MVRIEVVTLFPRMVHEALAWGIVGRAMARGLFEVGTEDPRDHADDVHRTVDDRPYGGGPGMVMKPGPLVAAIGAAARRVAPGSPRIYLSAQGEPLTQARAQALAQLPGLVLVAGRYEGIDERVIATSVDEELSIGDYVLSGGELPALVVIDALARLREGALNDARSSVEESFVDGLLDWPHYTRPEEYEGLRVPEVLQGGDHERIRRWRLKQALGRTWLRRPELFLSREATSEETELLNEFLQERQTQS